MALSLLTLGARNIVMMQWYAVSSGNNNANLFLQTQASQVAPGTTETAGQTPAVQRFNLWRFQASFQSASIQQATVTVRVNGVSQASTATVIGTAAGAVTTDVATPIMILAADLIGILFKTAVADGATSRPQGIVVGAAMDSL